MTTENIQRIITDFVQKLELIPENTVGDLNGIENSDIKAVLFQIITSSKFRRTAVNDDNRNDLHKKISDAVDANLPIEFAIPFGCYKSYLMPTYPEIDWAEIFSMRYIIAYVLPISKIYTPGVIVSYSQSQLVNEINNVPTTLRSSYVDSFKKLLSYFSDQCPNNVILRIQEINDLYDNETQWKEELMTSYNKNKANWETLYDQATREKKLTSAKHNFVIKGEKDFSQSGENELQSEYLKAAMMVDAIENLSKRRQFNKLSHRIQIVFLRGPAKSIHIGSCKSSTVQFWVGFGVAEIRKNYVLPKILSYTQMQLLKSRTQHFVTENKFSVISKNFKTLPYILEDK